MKMNQHLRLLAAPQRLTVVTDEECSLCRRCRAWLTAQPLLVEVEFLAVGSDEACRRYGPYGDRRDQLIVADEHGRIWTKSDAFVMCLWASDIYRGWAHLASTPGWRRLARLIFSTVSTNRESISDLLSGECNDDRCAPTQLAESQTPPTQTKRVDESMGVGTMAWA